MMPPIKTFQHVLTGEFCQAIRYTEGNLDIEPGDFVVVNRSGQVHSVEPELFKATWMEIYE